MWFLTKLLLVFVSAGLGHCQCRKQPGKVIAAMNGQDPNLRLVFAHRGLVGKGCVENSVCAIDAAAKTDADGIELDAQIANDFSLWPLHDTRIGRITNYKLSPTDSYFDILKDDPMGPKNPRIRLFNSLQLNSLFLRDIEGNVLEGQYLHSLSYLLSYIKVEYPGMAVVLDVKSPDAVTPAANLVNRLGMQDRTVIKFIATWLAPSEVRAALKGCKFAVVSYVNMLDRFAEEGTGPTLQDKVENYLGRYIALPNYVSMEPPSKNFVLDGEVAKPTGPGGFVDRWMINVERRGIGKFHQSNDYSLGSVDSLGHCCVLPDRYLATSKIFGKELPDQRTNVELLLKAADWITTDKAIDVLAAASRGGYRINRYKLC